MKTSKYQQELDIFVRQILNKIQNMGYDLFVQLKRATIKKNTNYMPMLQNTLRTFFWKCFFLQLEEN